MVMDKVCATFEWKGFCNRATISTCLMTWTLARCKHGSLSISVHPIGHEHSYENEQKEPNSVEVFRQQRFQIKVGKKTSEEREWKIFMDVDCYYMNIEHIVNINMKLDARLSGTCFIVLSNRSSWNSSWTGSDIRTVVVYDQQRHTVSSHTHKLTSVPVCCPSDRVKCLQLLRHNRCCLWLDAEQRECVSVCFHMVHIRVRIQGKWRNISLVSV